MKLLLALFMYVFLSAVLFSRDITTLSGTTYKNATVFDSNPGELIISYPDKDLTVVKPIPFTDLPDDIKKEFKYDPVKGEAFEKARSEWKKNKAAADINKKSAVNANGEKAVKQDLLKMDEQLELQNDISEAESTSVKKEAVGNRAPNEKAWGAEGRELKREALEGGKSPNEKDWAAEGKALKREALESGRAPGEKEGAAEGDATRRQAMGYSGD